MHILQITDSFATIIFICVLSAGVWCFVKNKNTLELSKGNSKLFQILSIVLGCSSAMYYVLFAQKSNISEVAVFSFFCLIYSFSWYYIIKVLYAFSADEALVRERYTSAYLRKVLILGSIWLPYILASYPASFCPDSIYQLHQSLGYSEVTTHHPIAHTQLIGNCVKLGNGLFSSYDVGIFLYVLIQFFLLLFLFTYMIHYLEKLEVSRKVLAVLWGIFGVCPLIVGYVGVVLKDVVYSAFVAWFVLFCVKFAHDYILNIDLILGLIISGIGTIITRNNGIYVIVPTCIVILTICFVKRRSAIDIFKGILVVLLPIIVANCLNVSLGNYYHAKTGSVAEALSLCFQQTARVVVEHDDKLSEEEKKIIDNVLDYENLADNYNPYLSDSVKGTYKECGGEEFEEYIKLWGKQFLKYPDTYIKATLQQNFALLCLPLRNQIYYTVSEVSGEEGTVITENVLLEKVLSYFVKFWATLDYVPFVNMFCSSSFYCIMLLVLTVYVFVRKCWKMLVPFLPLWITFLICIAAPGIINHPRYTFPIVYSLPFLYGYFLVCERENKSKTLLFCNVKESFRRSSI